MAEQAYDSRPDTYEHIGKVQRLLTRAACNLLDRALHHDQSKLIPPEREAFDRMTPKLAGLTYGTPEYKASLAELGPALQHHYELNHHHPEHFEKGIRGMSLLDLLEMLVDWKAASERMKSSEGSSFLGGIMFNQERFGYSDELTQILINTAIELGLEDPVAYGG